MQAWIGAYIKGKLFVVFCKYDGDKIGMILHMYYDTKDKIEELFNMGGISTLGRQIGVKHDPQLISAEHTTFYGRDYGIESLMQEVTMQEFLALKGHKYLYQYEWRKWDGITWQHVIPEYYNEEAGVSEEEILREKVTVKNDDFSRYAKYRMYAY